MNMWGIHSPFSTPVPEREDRMIGAAKIIKTEQYDFVMFQVCKMKPKSFRGSSGILKGSFWVLFQSHTLLKFTYRDIGYIDFSSSSQSNFLLEL